MAVLAFPAELSDARALAGRTVKLTVPVRYPSGWSPAAISSATARARQELHGLLEDARSSLEAFPAGDGADLSVTGRLLLPWSSTYALRADAVRRAQKGAEAMGFSWPGLGAEDVSLLDLDEPPVERAVLLPTDRNWYTDPTGESNPDGTVNYGGVLKAGAEEGLENLGAGVGAVGRGVGQGAASLVGGIFSGLGVGGTVVVLLVLAVLALLALSYAFGGPRLLGVL